MKRIIDFLQSPLRTPGKFLQRLAAVILILEVIASVIVGGYFILSSWEVSDRYNRYTKEYETKLYWDEASFFSGLAVLIVGPIAATVVVAPLSGYGKIVEAAERQLADKAPETRPAEAPASDSPVRAFLASRPTKAPASDSLVKTFLAPKPAAEKNSRPSSSLVVECEYCHTRHMSNRRKCYQCGEKLPTA